MAKKITVVLTDEAEKHFHNVAYGLEGKNGMATHSEVINACLLELYLFEKFTVDNQLLNWLIDNYPVQWAEWHKQKYPEQYNEDGTVKF